MSELLDIFPTPSGTRHHGSLFEDAATRGLADSLLSGPSADLVESLTEHLCKTVTHSV